MDEESLACNAIDHTDVDDAMQRATTPISDWAVLSVRPLIMIGINWLLFFEFTAVA